MEDSEDEVDERNDPTFDPDVSRAKNKKDKSKKRLSVRPKKKKVPFEMNVSNGYSI